MKSKSVCELEECVYKQKVPLKFPETLFVTNSKAEGVLCGVTISGTQPFPRQNRGKETMA
jgi:hypothetical protein